MKLNIQLAIACATTTFAASSFALNPAEHSAEKDRISAEYKAAKERCDALSGNAKDTCVTDAKRKYGQ